MTTGTVNVRILSDEDIEARKATLRAEAGGRTLRELRNLAYDYRLSIEDLEVLREMERINFLAAA
ncbi:hypothetical protein [Microbacterium gubbeenense]|uniref:hypothetical protein n=1 Tax=Microbacterium gubbeenense TaxID=159896 RepID=UPI0003FDC1CD|nr:hypothetical protein [Microbacterium gubbeenense]